MYSILLTDFHSSSLQSISSPLQALLHLLSTLTTDHNVICKHHSWWRLMLDLICQPVNHPCKQEGTEPIPDVIPTFNPSVTPTRHLTTVLLSSFMSCNILTYFSSAPVSLMQYCTSVPLLVSYLMLSLDLQRHNATPSELLHSSPLATVNSELQKLDLYSACSWHEATLQLTDHPHYS